MNRLAVFVIFLSISCSNTPEHPMGWLIGRWERSNLPAGREAFEFWRMNEEGNLVGEGISVKNGDTVVFEKLSIEKMGDTYYYIADVPENPEPVKYLVTSSKVGAFQSANPEHDFPKAINYQLKGQRLLVEISGDGRSIPFEFVRMK